MDTGYYKGKLRILDVDKMLSESPDPRPLYCPDCSAVTVGGWCKDCGFDWPDGCTKELKAANPHVYGTAADCEAKLVELSDRYRKHGHDPRVRERYKNLHEHWLTVR